MKIISNYQTILLKTVFLDYFQSTPGSSTCRWITSVSIKISDSFLLEGISYFSCSNYSSHWKAITHCLTKCHHVRNYIVILERPKISPNSSHSTLHLIYNTDSPFFFYNFKYFLKIIFWGYYLTCTTLKPFTYKSCNLL